MSRYKEILTRQLGEKLHYYKEVDSTNTVAKKMARFGHGIVIVSESQTAGRGTYGRRFYSKSGSGIYMSVVVDTDVWHFKNAQLATPYTAVAVSEAVSEVTKITPDIKWVNDLFLDGKKIGGILTEKEFQSNKLIIGIGINLSQRLQDFPSELQDIATSLELEPPIDDQAAAIVARIYERIVNRGKLSDVHTVLKLYKDKLFIMGRVVHVVCRRDVFEAKVVDIDDTGKLVVIRDGEQSSLSVDGVRVKLLE